jgi:hypothetical protein
MEQKLAEIGIWTVSGIHQNIVTLNYQLNVIGYFMMHLATLQAMMELGTKAVDEQLCMARAEVNKLRHTLKKCDQANKEKDNFMSPALAKTEMGAKPAAREDGWFQVGTSNSAEGKTLLLGMEGSNKKDKIGPATWLGNTGASCDQEGRFNVKMITLLVKIGSGKSMVATKIRKMWMTVVQKDSLTQNIMLTEVKYVPELWVNLF